MRVFAGPNGSGKSTLKSVVDNSLLGVYINADDIQAAIVERGSIDLSQFLVDPPISRLVAFLEASPLLEKAQAESVGALDLKLDGSKLSLPAPRANAYVAAAIASFLREELLLSRRSFTFETVMSSPDKVALMRRALDCGYRVYLYYIATVNVEINISRVRNRVQSGGHGVPENKIVSRYERSLDLLYDAVLSTSRAYFFDNSTDNEESVWIAECTNGEDLTLKVEQVPEWFAEHVIDRAKSV